jgi:hypothetical protein
MDMFFADPSEIPLPPDEVRIREVLVEPYPDGRRVRVTLEVDPFQQRPNLDLLALNPAGQRAAGASIIETMTRKMSLTLHIRPAEAGDYTLNVILFYNSRIEPPEAEDAPPPVVERTVVDRRDVAFTLPAPQS